MYPNNFDSIRSYVGAPRPAGITVIALLHVLGGLGNLCAGVGALATVALCNFGGLVVGPKGIIGGVLMFIVAGALLGGQSWARWLAIIASGLNFLNLLRGGINTGGEFFWICVSVGMLVYMFTPGVQAYFNRRY
jgi:hypothetical protein